MVVRSEKYVGKCNAADLPQIRIRATFPKRVQVQLGGGLGLISPQPTIHGIAISAGLEGDASPPAFVY